MRRVYNNPEVKALIMDWLERHGRWGKNYFPLDTLVNKLSHIVKNNGKNIKMTIKELQEQGYILVHKGGDTISLNPTKSKEITDHIRKVFRI